MSHYNLAFLGFGNVGRSLARLLLSKRQELQQRYSLTFSITGVATGSHGAAIDHDGIDLPRLLAVLDEQPTVPLEAFSVLPPPTDSFDFIHRCGADVLFENTPVNYATGQPAVDHLRLALEQGMHAITANKGPVVHAYRTLSELAAAHGLKFYFESAVMDGAPVFSLFRTTLPGARLNSLYGVLNSTTNMILTRMEQGESFEAAVAYCQKIGIAETDPSGDIDGWDAAVKVSALVTVLMDYPLKPQQVERQGIRQISAQDVAQASANGQRWKLVCSAERRQGGVNARVYPVLVDRTSPLYSAEGTTSVIQFETDVLGRLTLIEENPGPMTTAYGCLADFLNAVLG